MFNRIDAESILQSIVDDRVHEMNSSAVIARSIMAEYRFGNAVLHKLLNKTVLDSRLATPSQKQTS